MHVLRSLCRLNLWLFYRAPLTGVFGVLSNELEVNPLVGGQYKFLSRMVLRASFTASFKPSIAN